MPNSNAPKQPDQLNNSLPTALAWACFLGCSWTWVIGMFFPIMLLRDYGVAGWLVFLTPSASPPTLVV